MSPRAPCLKMTALKRIALEQGEKKGSYLCDKETVIAEPFARMHKPETLLCDDDRILHRDLIALVLTIALLQTHLDGPCDRLVFVHLFVFLALALTGHDSSASSRWLCRCHIDVLIVCV